MNKKFKWRVTNEFFFFKWNRLELTVSHLADQVISTCLIANSVLVSGNNPRKILSPLHPISITNLFFYPMILVKEPILWQVNLNRMEILCINFFKVVTNTFSSWTELSQHDLLWVLHIQIINGGSTKWFRGDNFLQMADQVIKLEDYSGSPI